MKKRLLNLRLDFRQQPIADAIDLLQQAVREGFTDARVSVAKYDDAPLKVKVKR